MLDKIKRNLKAIAIIGGIGLAAGVLCKLSKTPYDSWENIPFKFPKETLEALEDGRLTHAHYEREGYRYSIDQL